MKRTTLANPSAILSMVALCASAAFGNPRPLQDFLEPIRNKFRAPAVAAAAVQDGQVVALGAVGVRELGRDAAVTTTDRTLIGSCGKAATRLLIGRLVDQGKLRWDSTLQELLPDVSMREEYKPVTLGDIIAHKGGLQPYTMISPGKTPFLFELSGSPREQRAAFAAHLLSEAPSAPPGTRFVYSNAGYGLLGHIAERACDKPYEQLMRDEVFRTLEMKSAAVGMPLDLAGAAGWTGHAKSNEGFEPVPARAGLPPLSPAGLMSMSIEDFARLAAVLVQVELRIPGEFLKESSLAKLPDLRPGVRGEGEIFYGGDGRYTAAFALWPSKKFAVVVQTNAGSADQVCKEAIEAVLAALDMQSLSQGARSSTAGRPRFGFQIEAEDENSDWTVVAVEADSAAAKGGLLQGDIITALNGTPLKDIAPDSRLTLIKASPLKLRVRRSGQDIELTLTLPPPG